MNGHDSEDRPRVPSRLKSDMPDRGKKGPGRTVRLIGLAVLITLLTTFIFVMVRRSSGRNGDATGAVNLKGVTPLEPELPMHYVVRVPEDYDRNEEYQLVIGLHGFEKSEEQFTWMWDDGVFYRPDFILVGVRAPFRSGAGYTWFGAGPGEKTQTGKYEPAAALTDEQRILAVLAEVEQKYRIDPDSRIVLGVSQGACIAHFMVLRHPETFSGLADFGGRIHPAILPEVTSENAGHLEVFIGMGREEGGIALRATETSAEAFRKAGARVKYDLHDEGHVIKAEQVRAMENFFDLAASKAPLDDYEYNSDGSPKTYRSPGPGREPVGDEGMPEDDAYGDPAEGDE